jgi:hypothetical protein
MSVALGERLTIGDRPVTARKRRTPGSRPKRRDAPPAPLYHRFAHGRAQGVDLKQAVRKLDQFERVFEVGREAIKREASER